jgi:anaerobic selenocysteine-containing dehydrogenase
MQSLLARSHSAIVAAPRPKEVPRLGTEDECQIDPRFTRTSALADLYAPIRAGSDIAFLGGVIRHLLENDRPRSGSRPDGSPPCWSP